MSSIRSGFQYTGVLHYTDLDQSGPYVGHVRYWSSTSLNITQMIRDKHRVHKKPFTLLGYILSGYKIMYATAEGENTTMQVLGHSFSSVILKISFET